MKISDLLLNHINRDYLLPSIQREFVWGRKDNKIEKLFDSLLQAYPIGQILCWNVNKAPDLENIKWEIYNFVQNYDEDTPHNIIADLHGYSKLFLILDGQQRLSALNLGLKGTYSFSYRNKKKRTKLFLNLLSEIENNIDNTYGLKYEFKFFEEPPTNQNELWFEVGNVLDYHNKTTEDFKEDNNNLIRDRATSSILIKKAKITLGRLHQVICIDDCISESHVINDDDEKVLNIFVRTNDGGIKLEKADLLLSYMESNKKLFVPKGARKEIFAFTDELNKVEVHKPDYDFKKDDILKSCLVLSDLEVQYKLKNFNEDNLKIISDNWDLIKKYLKLTVELIARYGFSIKNVISKNALIPIAYYLKMNSKSNEFVASQQNSDLETKNEIIKWLSLSQMSGAFGSSSDSTLKSVRKNIDEGKSFKEINLGKIIYKEDIEKWINKECYQSRLSHLILLLVSKDKYWDNCHQDHIFAICKFDRELYKKMGLSQDEIIFYDDKANSIANLHLLNPSVNIVKRDDDFIDWSSNKNKEFLESSLIPQQISLEFSNFKDFIMKRENLIIDKLSDILLVERT
ncbi:MAG: DUF262 domain-containing protein [Candidatus Scalinduaceae bacterium]